MTYACIDTITTTDNGGDCIVDTITLQSGMIICITPDAMVVYRDADQKAKVDAGEWVNPADYTIIQ